MMGGQDFGPVWNTMRQSVHRGNCSGTEKSTHMSQRVQVAKLNQIDSIMVKTCSFTIHVHGTGHDCALVSVTAETLSPPSLSFSLSLSLSPPHTHAHACARTND